MRSTLLNRSNSNVLGLRRDRRASGRKEVLAVVIAHAQSFFFRHACPTPAHYLTTLERQLKRVVDGTPAGSILASVAMCMSPTAGTCGLRGWQAVGMPRQYSASRS